MAYTKKGLHEKAMKAMAKDTDIVFFEDIADSIHVSKTTLYKYKVNEMDDIKEALERNKRFGKKKIRKKWGDSDNVTAQIAFYRLLSTPEEHRLLNQQYNELTGKDGGNLIQQLDINIINKHKKPKPPKDE